MKDIKKSLSAHNLKNTPTRRAILKCFRSTKEPISLKQLQKRIPDVDQTTLYRNVNTFTQKGLLERAFEKEEASYYQLKENHHHHAICTNCHATRCINNPKLEAIMNSISKDLKDFTDISHQLSFSGVCQKCCKV